MCQKISIITVTYNNAKTVEETILSILRQKYPYLEYIIVYSASKDDTLAIIIHNGTKKEAFLQDLLPELESGYSRRIHS